MSFSLVYITFPNKKEARRIAKILIKEKLCACCNIFPIGSFYFWQGKLQDSKEFAMLVKTKANLIGKIIKKVKELHSYQVPCIISFSIEKGNKEFLNWIERNIK